MDTNMSTCDDGWTGRADSLLNEEAEPNGVIKEVSLSLGG